MRFSNRFLPVGQAAGCLLVALAVGGGLFREAEAQIPPLEGMSVTSYSISATVASPGEPATLSLQSSANPAFDPTAQFASSTGDEVNGTNWLLYAIGVDYSPLVPTLNNIIGLQAEADGNTLTAGDTIGGQWVMSFALDQRFDQLLGDSVTAPAASLTPSGGTAIDLTTTAAGTVFPAGSYTLDMLAQVDSSSPRAAAVVLATTAVPEPATLGLAAGGAASVGLGFWRWARRASR